MSYARLSYLDFGKEPLCKDFGKAQVGAGTPKSPQETTAPVSRHAPVPSLVVS
jgi:hypothetical protein